ncbi:hypothetical protein B0A50_03423 [Salinomyces thailandicus]|uniref:Transmembrane protein n=1 Tax=Salinomyces thailandicus TaxID=706561 RepID=A0A4U0U220_9PEZI|nr:hypothetical protein B0A50_03423 [Salinomyces thailandica]
MADEGAQKRIDIYLASTITILWYICWPLYYIATGVLYILKLLYWPVDFLLQPFVYLGRFLFACCLAPFQLLVKLEVVYIYLGVAAIVGVAIGVAIALIYSSLTSFIGSDSPSRRAQLRSAKEYRESKRRRKAAIEQPLTPLSAATPPVRISRDQVVPGHIGTSDSTRKGRRNQSLLSQTIMEEVDSDY